MYTSDTERAPLKRKRSRRALKSAGRYLLASAACMVIGVTYEYFSHDVWSVYMLFAFAVPLLAGALPSFTAWLLKLPEPAPSAEAVYACGIITLTAGSFLQGVLEIYGTTNPLIAVFPAAGALLAAAGIVTYFLCRKKAEV